MQRKLPTIVFPHLLRPARGGSAALIVVFAFLLTIAYHAGLLGIPLAFILTSWFFKYAYILFDHTVWGYDDPPTLDIQMLNPVDEQRPLAQLGILGLLYGAVKLAESRLGPAMGLSLAALSAVLFPASMAILGLERPQGGVSRRSAPHGPRSRGLLGGYRIAREVDLLSAA